MDVNSKEDGVMQGSSCGEPSVPEFYSPLFRGYLRGVCQELYKSPFKHSSVYGTYFLLDSMLRRGERVYVVALNSRFKPIDKWLAPILPFLEVSNVSDMIERFALEAGAEYVIVAKDGRTGGFPWELSYANRLFEALENVRLYDYVVIEDGEFRSYMERLR